MLLKKPKRFPLVSTFVTYQNTKMMVFRLNVLAKKVMLASEEGIIQEIDLDEFSRLPVISVPYPGRMLTNVFSLMPEDLAKSIISRQPDYLNTELSRFFPGYISFISMSRKK